MRHRLPALFSSIALLITIVSRPAGAGSVAPTDLKGRAIALLELLRSSRSMWPLYLRSLAELTEEVELAYVPESLRKGEISDIRKALTRAGKVSPSTVELIIGILKAWDQVPRGRANFGKRLGHSAAALYLALLRATFLESSPEATLLPAAFADVSARRGDQLRKENGIEHNAFKQGIARSIESDVAIGDTITATNPSTIQGLLEQAKLLHDLGTHHDGQQEFRIRVNELRSDLLQKHGISDHDSHQRIEKDAQTKILDPSLRLLFLRFMQATDSKVPLETTVERLGTLAKTPLETVLVKRPVGKRTKARK